MVFGRQGSDDAYPITGAARRNNIFRFVFMTLLATVVMAGYALTQFRGLRVPSAMETAQIARHLAEGRGFVTHCVRPFDLWYLQSRGIRPDASDSPIPVLWTAPGLPLLQAALFRLVRPNDVSRRPERFLNGAETSVIVPLGIMLTLLTTLAIWLLGRLIFSSRTALLAAGAYVVADLPLASSISGQSVPLTALAVTLAILLAVLAVRRSAALDGGWGVAGLTVLSAGCAAAAVLTNYTMLVAAAAVALLLGAELQRRQWLLLPLYLLVLSLLLLPWFLHNAGAGIGVFGALPYAALRDTPLFPGDALERSVSPVFNAYRMAAAVRHGFSERLATLADGAGFMRAGVMSCFFMLAMFHRYDRTVCRALKVVTLVALAVLALLPAVPGDLQGDGWIALYPLVALFGMSAFVDFLDGEDYFDPSIKPLLTTLVLVLCALPAGLKMLRGPDFAYPPYHAPLQQFAATVPEAGKTLLTDIPWATSWYGDRASMLLPLNPDDVAALPGGWEAVGGVYLTSPATATAGGESRWTLMLLGRQTPESVPFTHGVSLPTGRHDQLLLTNGQQNEP